MHNNHSIIDRLRKYTPQWGRVAAVFLLVGFAFVTVTPSVLALDPDQALIYKNDIQWYDFKDRLITNSCGTGGAANITVGKDFSLGPLGDAAGRQVSLMQALIRDFTLTPMQAAGVVGNFMAESGGKNLPPDVNEGGKQGPPAFSGGYGWAQWTGSRQHTFIDYVTPPQNTYMSGPDVPATDAANYAYLTKELNEGYRTNTLAPLKGASTVEDAALLFERGFERPAASNAGTRGQYGQEALAAFNGGGGAGTTTTTTSGGGSTTCGDSTVGNADCNDSVSCAKLLLQMEKDGKVKTQPGGETDLQTTAAGKQVTACVSQGFPAVTIDVTLLQKLVMFANWIQTQDPKGKMQLEIHNFVSQHGCDQAYHPKGRASDVNIAGVPGDTGQHLDLVADYQLPQNKNFAQYVMTNLPPGGGLGQMQYIGSLTNTAGKRYFDDGNLHFHIDVGKDAK